MLCPGTLFKAKDYCSGFLTAEKCPGSPAATRQLSKRLLFEYVRHCHGAISRADTRIIWCAGSAADQGDTCVLGLKHCSEGCRALSRGFGACCRKGDVWHQPKITPSPRITALMKKIRMHSRPTRVKRASPPCQICPSCPCFATATRPHCTGL